LTDVVYPKVKDYLDGQPLFYIEEYEDEGIPNDGENIEDVQPRTFSRRKVNFYIKIKSSLLC
jgi:hypothetical protein